MWRVMTNLPTLRMKWRNVIVRTIANVTGGIGAYYERVIGRMEGWMPWKRDG